MKSKVLLIVEGEKTEKEILGNQSHGLLSLLGTDYEIVSFANPIYELYEAYKKDEYDDLVSYLRYEKGLKLENEALSKNAFAAIYLVFDFEPQDHKYSDDSIKDLLSIFNNETELGKLYINYPMVEAYFHLESLPDPNYIDRTISLENLNGYRYKKLVNETTCLKKNKITVKELCYIIDHNYKKATYITGKLSKEVDHEKVLDIMLKSKNERNEIYVLSTFPLIAIDYNYEKTLEIISTNLNTN